MIARFSALKATVAAFTILGALGARPDEPAIPERTDLRVIARLSEERFAGSPGHILAFSPDGKLLAEATFGIGIWDVSTGKRVVKLNGHWAGGLSLTRRGVSAIAFSNDGQTLYSTGGDGAIRVWEVTTGMLLKEILVPWLWVDANLNWSHGLVPLYGLSVTSDAKRLATTAHGGSVHVWNLETGELDWSLGKNVAEKIDPAKFGPIELKNIQEVWKLPLDPRVPHPRPLFSPDGNSLVLALNDGVQAWNVKDRTQKFKTTTGGAVRYSPDGLSLVTVRSDDITIWDAQTGERTGGFVSELPMTAPLRFLPDGRLVTGIDEGNGIRICKFPAGRPAKSFAHGRESPRGMAVSPDGGLLAAAFDGSRLQLWDIRTGKLQNDGGHSAPVNALRFSPDGRFLISGSSDCSLRVWETNEWTQQQSLVQPKMYVSALEFLPGGDRILVGDRTGTSRRIRVPALDVEESFKHEDGINGYAVRDAQLFVAIDRNPGTLETWDLNGKPNRIASRKQHPTYGMRMASAPGQRLMASGDYDGNVVVWRDNPAEPVASFHADGERIEAIAFSPDGQRLATVCGNNSERRAILEIRDSIQWTVQTRLQVGGSGITSIAWSPDATTLAIATMGRPSTIFFVTQNHLESVEFPETEFCSICFSPDGQYLAGGAEDGAITIWSFESQK